MCGCRLAILLKCLESVAAKAVVIAHDKASNTVTTRNLADKLGGSHAPHLLVKVEDDNTVNTRRLYQRYFLIDIGQQSRCQFGPYTRQRMTVKSEHNGAQTMLSRLVNEVRQQVLMTAMNAVKHAYRGDRFHVTFSHQNMLRLLKLYL